MRVSLGQTIIVKGDGFHLRNNEQRASLTDVENVLLNFLFRVRVERRSSLIQHDNSRILEDGTSDSNSLLLTATKTQSAFSDLCVITIGE